MTAITTSVALSLLLTLGACTGDDLQSLDGEYRVSITQSSNTCDGVGVGDGAAGLTTRLDLFRRSNGLFDLHWVDGWVPDAYAFSAVELGGGGDVAQGLGSANEIRGRVSTDELALELVHRGVTATGQACEQRATVHGRRRPMFDLDSVDGRYIVGVQSLGGTCPDGRALPPTSVSNMRMEVLPFRDDRTSVVIEDATGGLIRFWIAPIGRGGSIQLTHDVFFSATPDHITQLDGTVDGTIEPATVALTATVVDKADSRACTTSYAISGHRWIPNASPNDAEYEAHYHMTDSCDPSYDVTYEQVVEAVGQQGHRIDLIDNVIQSTVSLDGTAIAASTGSPSYRGTVAPDHASYVVEDHYTSPARACVLTLQVDGSARYR